MLCQRRRRWHNIDPALVRWRPSAVFSRRLSGARLPVVNYAYKLYGGQTTLKRQEDVRKHKPELSGASWIDHTLEFHMPVVFLPEEAQVSCFMKLENVFLLWEKNNLY